MDSWRCAGGARFRRQVAAWISTGLPHNLPEPGPCSQQLSCQDKEAIMVINLRGTTAAIMVINLRGTTAAIMGGWEQLQPASNSGQAGKQDPPICLKYNEFDGDCRFGSRCTFAHVCSTCKERHPVRSQVSRASHQHLMSGNGSYRWTLPATG